LDKRDDITGVVTANAYFIRTWQSTDTQWSIQYMQCMHFKQPVVAYYASNASELYIITHYILAGTYVNEFTDSSALAYFDFTSNRGQAANFIMEFDFTKSLSNTAYFSFVSGSNYYMLITVSEVFWTSSSYCEIAGGLENSYGGKPTCSWINWEQMLITNFDSI